MAYIQTKYDVCDLLVQEGLSISMKILLIVIQQDKTSVQYVKKTLQHLKDYASWDPKSEYASIVLAISYVQQKYDVSDLLVQEGVPLTMKTLLIVIQQDKTSAESVKKAIQHLKGSANWNPKCENASIILAMAYVQNKYGVCDLLVQEGVPLTMRTLLIVIQEDKTYNESVKKTIQHLKDSANWDPKGEIASKILAMACVHNKYDVCDLLVQEGVPLTMKTLLIVIQQDKTSTEYVKKTMQHLKDSANWYPKGENASIILAMAYVQKRYDLCDLLLQERVPLRMKTLCIVIQQDKATAESVEKIIQHLKDSENWDPKCENASFTLAIAYVEQKHDLCNLLIQEGVPLSMKTLLIVIQHDKTSVESVEKTIQHLKYADNWNPKCENASILLAMAYVQHKYGVCDLLVQEGIRLTMMTLFNVIQGDKTSTEYVKKIIQHLKDSANWDPKCENASLTLAIAYVKQNYDVCNLLVQEGVSLTMRSLPFVVVHNEASLESVKKAIQHLKDTGNWDPKCHDAFVAQMNAFDLNKYDVYFFLVHEGFYPPRMILCVLLCAIVLDVDHLVDRYYRI